mgnify:CR=1 FL=1
MGTSEDKVGVMNKDMRKGGEAGGTRVGTMSGCFCWHCYPCPHACCHIWLLTRNLCIHCCLYHTCEGRGTQMQAPIKGVAPCCKPSRNTYLTSTNTHLTVRPAVMAGEAVHAHTMATLIGPGRVGKVRLMTWAYKWSIHSPPFSPCAYPTSATSRVAR